MEVGRTEGVSFGYGTDTSFKGNIVNFFAVIFAERVLN